MSSKDDFEEKLAIGIAGEDIAYSYLIRNNSFVEDLRNKVHDNGIGPRLKGTEGSLVSPDFAVYNKDPRKGNYLVDVKVKSYIYPVNGKMCFTVDNKFEQYIRVTQIKKLDFLMLIFIYEDRMYFYKDSDLTCTTTFANGFSDGLVYCFEHNKNKIRY
jgi:hypothetical protein